MAVVHVTSDLGRFRKQRTPIGPYDVLIAAQARRSGATLVTANTSEFERVFRIDCRRWGGV